MLRRVTQAQTAIITIRDHENLLVAFLKTSIGAVAVAKPSFDFTGGIFANVFCNDTFLAVAQVFEDTGARAYKGQTGGSRLSSVQGFRLLKLQVCN